MSDIDGPCGRCGEPLGGQGQRHGSGPWVHSGRSCKWRPFKARRALREWEARPQWPTADFRVSDEAPDAASAETHLRHYREVERARQRAEQDARLREMDAECDRRNREERIARLARERGGVVLTPEEVRQAREREERIERERELIYAGYACTGVASFRSSAAPRPRRYTAPLASASYYAANVPSNYLDLARRRERIDYIADRLMNGQ